jgi:hypothetical protein
MITAINPLVRRHHGRAMAVRVAVSASPWRQTDASVGSPSRPNAIMVSPGGRALRVGLAEPVLAAGCRGAGTMMPGARGGLRVGRLAMANQSCARDGWIHLLLLVVCRRLLRHTCQVVLEMADAYGY